MRVTSPAEVRDFWFSEAARPNWFAKDAGFDRAIVERFGATYEAAHARALEAWARDPEDMLALLITLDQFPRNMFRGSPRSFESGEIALHHARRALARGFDRAVAAQARPFFYLPFMHSEALADQELSVALYEVLGDANSLRFALAHREIIARFGRFAHRNAVLGRESTPEEAEFLKTNPGF